MPVKVVAISGMVATLLLIVRNQIMVYVANTGKQI